MAPTIPRTAPVYWVMVKSEWFETFNQQFKEHVTKVPEDQGYAQTINVECLQQAINEGADWIIILMSNEDLSYRISTKLWYNYAMKFKLIRKQKERDTTLTEWFSQGRSDMVSEKVFCIPMRLLEPLTTAFEKYRD